MAEFCNRGQQAAGLRDVRAHGVSAGLVASAIAAFSFLGRVAVGGTLHLALKAEIGRSRRETSGKKPVQISPRDRGQ